MPRLLSITTIYGEFSLALDDSDVIFASFFGQNLKFKDYPQIPHHPYIENITYYFKYKDQKFLDSLPIRISGTRFRTEALKAIKSITYGKTKSYKEIANILGKNNAQRAVGNICAHNTLPLLIPCHRVIKSDNSLGNYLYGAKLKEKLLRFEGAIN